MTKHSTAPSLFTTHHAGGRLLYKLYFTVFLAGIFYLFYYRLTHVPPTHRPLWFLVTAAEFWFAAVWFFQQGFRWRPTYHRTFKEHLPRRLPPVDVFLCTADPVREPPELVANTLLSLMAYDYPVNKLAFYVSDDGASELTLNAVHQAAIFAKAQLPFCRKFNVEPRSPQAFFSSENDFSAANASQGFRQDIKSSRLSECIQCRSKLWPCLLSTILKWIPLSKTLLKNQLILSWTLHQRKLKEK